MKYLISDYKPSPLPLAFKLQKREVNLAQAVGLLERGGDAEETQRMSEDCHDHKTRYWAEAWLSAKIGSKTTVAVAAQKELYQRVVDVPHTHINDLRSHILVATAV